MVDEVHRHFPFFQPTKQPGWTVDEFGATLYGFLDVINLNFLVEGFKLGHYCRTFREVLMRHWASLFNTVEVRLPAFFGLEKRMEGLARKEVAVLG